MIQNQSEIDGFFDFSEVYDFIAKQMPNGGNFAEVGVFRGASLIYLASKIKELGKTANLYAIDHWPKRHEYNKFFANCIEYGVVDMIKPIWAASDIAHYTLPANCWAIMLDGDHRSEQVARDIYHYLPKTTHALYGHDIQLKSVEVPVKNAFGNYYYKWGNTWVYEVEPMCDFCMMSCAEIPHCICPVCGSDGYLCTSCLECLIEMKCCPQCG